MLFELKQTDLATSYDFSSRVMGQLEIEAESLCCFYGQMTLNGRINRY